MAMNTPQPNDEAIDQWMKSLGLEAVPTDSGGYFNDGMYIGAEEAAFFYQVTKAAVLAGTKPYVDLIDQTITGMRKADFTDAADRLGGFLSTLQAEQLKLNEGKQ